MAVKDLAGHEMQVLAKRPKLAWQVRHIAPSVVQVWQLLAVQRVQAALLPVE